MRKIETLNAQTNVIQMRSSERDDRRDDWRETNCWCVERQIRERRVARFLDRIDKASHIRSTVLHNITRTDINSRMARSDNDECTVNKNSANLDGIVQ